MSTVEQLKTGTTDLHQRIERVVPLLDPDLTLAEYAAYLDTLYPFYAQIEQRLERVRGLRTVVTDLDERWKTGLLAQDLFALGVPAALDVDPEMRTLKLDTLPEALGCLYVLEGSTLGAQILVRAVREKLGDSVTGKTSFLASYGEKVSQKWRSLCAAFTAAPLSPFDEGTAVASARTTFCDLHDWLVSRKEALAR